MRLQGYHDPGTPETDRQLKTDGGGVSAALPADRPVFVHKREFHASQYDAGPPRLVGGQTAHIDGGDRGSE